MVKRSTAVSDQWRERFHVDEDTMGITQESISSLRLQLVETTTSKQEHETYSLKVIKLKNHICW